MLYLSVGADGGTLSLNLCKTVEVRLVDLVRELRGPARVAGAITTYMHRCMLQQADFWASAFVGHELGPEQQATEREHLMRQRLQGEASLCGCNSAACCIASGWLADVGMRMST